MAFNKVDFSKVPLEDLEELSRLEDEWRKYRDSKNTKKWQDFYTQRIEPFTRGVYYDRDDLKSWITLKRRDSKINQLVYG